MNVKVINVRITNVLLFLMENRVKIMMNIIIPANLVHIAVQAGIEFVLNIKVRTRLVEMKK